MSLLLESKDALRTVAEECQRKGVRGVRDGGLSVMRVGELK